MFKTIRTTERFLSNNTKDMDAYDQILNDPLCSVLREHKEKIKEVETHGEGMTSHKEWVEYLVTWEKKVLV